jgi:hypothetical protein
VCARRLLLEWEHPVHAPLQAVHPEQQASSQHAEVWAECAKPQSLAIAARLVGASPAAIAQVDQLSDEIPVGQLADDPQHSPK